MEVDSIYKVCRAMKKREQSLYNALRSIYHDSLFVQEIAQLWPLLPLLANLRCGAWYAPSFDDVCYFKSTDGHNGNWSFNVTRLNLHVAAIAAERGGCLIVDATRKGKRFPDSMSKTIPIWACVVNRAVADRRKMMNICMDSQSQQQQDNDTDDQKDAGVHCRVSEISFNGDVHKPDSLLSPSPVVDLQYDCLSRITEDWDCALHLPLWVSETEKNNIERLVDRWVDDLKTSGADLTLLASALRKPLRTLWISQKTVIWLNEVADVASWDFTPIILVSTSQPGTCTQRMSDAEFSWSYIPGAADDEESWARGLTPSLYWKHCDGLLADGPDDCNRKVAEIVERDRVSRSLRGQHAPQVRVKAGKIFSAPAEETSTISKAVELETTRMTLYGCMLEPKDRDMSNLAGACHTDNGYQRGAEDWILQTTKKDIFTEITGPQSIVGPVKQPDVLPGLHWIGSTGLVVGNFACCQADGLHEMVDCVIDCSNSSSSSYNREPQESYLHLAITWQVVTFPNLWTLVEGQSSKFDRSSLKSHLPEAVNFARKKLAHGLSIFICCQDGEDISVCVCLAILLSLFDSAGNFCGKSDLRDRIIAKSDVRQSLVFLASFHSGARPSRGSLKQVYNYLLNKQSPEQDATYLSLP